MKTLSSTELSDLPEENIHHLLKQDDEITITYYGKPKINISIKKLEVYESITLHRFCRYTHYRLKEKLQGKDGFKVVSYNGSNGFDKKTKVIFYGRLIE